MPGGTFFARVYLQVYLDYACRPAIAGRCVFTKRQSGTDNWPPSGASGWRLPGNGDSPPITYRLMPTGEQDQLTLGRISHDSAE